MISRATHLFERHAARALRISITLLLLSLTLGGAAGSPLNHHADGLADRLSETGTMPPTPAGVTAIKFGEFYKNPVGPRGLELTERIRALDGERVRILGFMIRQERPVPGTMMLAPFALATLENEYGLCDDLPPSVVFAKVSKYADIAVPFTPGPLLLTGRLELGAREEADGRVSHLRIVLDEESIPAPALVVETGK
jgi:hypothetical protein